MNISSFVFFGATLAGVIYVVMAFFAMSAVPQDKKKLLSSRMIVYFYWWPFYSDMFDDQGRKLCNYGRILLPTIFALYIIAAYLKNN